jgi:hypothetical protein
MYSCMCVCVRVVCVVYVRVRGVCTRVYVGSICFSDYVGYLKHYQTGSQE